LTYRVKLAGKASNPLEQFRQTLLKGQITQVQEAIPYPEVNVVYSRAKGAFHCFHKDLAYSKAQGASYQDLEIDIKGEKVTTRVTMAGCAGIKICKKCLATYPMSKKRCCSQGEFTKCGEDCSGKCLLISTSWVLI